MSKRIASNTFYFKVYNVPEKKGKREIFQILEDKFDGLIITSDSGEFDENKFTHHNLIRTKNKVKVYLFYII